MKKFITILAAVATLLGSVVAATATLTLSFDVNNDNKYDYTFTDSNGDGVISVNQAMGEFIVNVTTGLSLGN